MTITTASPYIDVAPFCSLDRSDANHVASLPYFPLYVAAQFASKDQAKLLLTTINVEKVGDNVEITSTDGHRCFRFVFPSDNTFFVNSDKSRWHISIDANVFRKKFINGAVRVDIYNSDNNCNLIDKNHKTLISLYGWRTPEYGTYPNCNQLFPDDYKELKKIAFNADYLASFCKMVSKFSPNGTVKMNFTHTVGSCVMESDIEIEGIDAELKMEYLLMPVQVRY